MSSETLHEGPPSSSLPVCLVLGIETQIGVGVIRELGRAGIRTIGLANRESSIGRASRYLEDSIVVGPDRNPALITRIRELGEHYGGAVLLGISESDLQWLIESSAQFGQIQVVAPSAEVFERVLDKRQTLQQAEALGIRVPRTFSPSTLEEWHQRCDELRYPAIVKWADPHAAMPALRRHQLLLQKLEYAMDAEALRTIGDRFAPAGIWPLMQEYCPGRGLGQFFFMHKGQAIRRFQHSRIAEWPPEGGFSSVCDAVPLSAHQALQSKSIELLRAIGWEGCAMVEYRFDEQTGEAVLMEINGRFWGSFPLAVHAGAGFARLAYFVQGLGQTIEMPPIREDLRCRMVSTEIKRLMRILFQPGRIRDPHFKVRRLAEVARFATDFFRPATRYYLWDRDDPGPLWADLRNYAWRFRTSFQRKR